MIEYKDIKSAEALLIFLRHLSGERRLSIKTVEAYRNDITAFQLFITNHLGHNLYISDLVKLKPTDFRSFYHFNNEKLNHSRELLYNANYQQLGVIINI
jgi:integrase/recombinase XerC